MITPLQFIAAMFLLHIVAVCAFAICGRSIPKDARALFFQCTGGTACLIQFIITVGIGGPGFYLEAGAIGFLCLVFLFYAARTFRRLARPERGSLQDGAMIAAEVTGTAMKGDQ